MNAARSSVQQARPPSIPEVSLREEVAAALERLSRVLEQHGGDPLSPADHSPDPALHVVQERLRFLGQVAAGWAELSDDAVPVSGAGYGSTVVVEDVDRGGTQTFTLMTGALLDIDAGQVSLASPVGQALLGAAAGDRVTVHTPQGVRRLRVVSVRTLRERLDLQGLPDLPAEAGTVGA